MVSTHAGTREVLADPVTFSSQSGPGRDGAGGTTLVDMLPGFVTGVMVTFGGVALSTTLNSPTSVTAVIPAAKLVTAGSFDVAVKNPTPGGGTSAAIAFTVSNPNVTVTSISPTNALVGSAAFTLTVNGTGFVAASKILFNGAAITTTPIDSGNDCTRSGCLCSR